MREMTARIRFTTHSLGNVRQQDSRFTLLRTTGGQVMFLPTWHKLNMRLAAQILGRHQNVVDQIFWDVAVDGSLLADRWFHRYYKAKGRQRYAVHEAFYPGQIVSINCLVPARITDDDFANLLGIAGRYRGLSQYKPGEFGHYTIDAVRPRRAAIITQGSDAVTGNSA